MLINKINFTNTDLTKLIFHQNESFIAGVKVFGRRIVASFKTGNWLASKKIFELMINDPVAKNSIEYVFRNAKVSHELQRKIDTVVSTLIINKPSRTNQESVLSPSPTPSNIMAKLKEMGSKGEVAQITQNFINKHYGKPLPAKEDVVVPIQNEQGIVEWRPWVSLTREEKIKVTNTGTHKHNQLGENTPEHVVDAQFFSENGQHVYLKNDPREHHGNDHSSRAAIFSAAFAYLYAKYHPNYLVTEEDVTLCQIFAAGHDSGRQTEGPDVYDERSAEFAIEELHELGIDHEKIVQECRNSIADKDNKDLKNKSLLAKCVQNADCAEFQRLYLKQPVQDAEGFNNSRNYLDIFHDFKDLAGQNPDAPLLKNGLTYNNFLTELDFLRKEMNDFIYQTHKKENREKFSEKENYYQEILNSITPESFPLLNSALVQVNVKKS